MCRSWLLVGQMKLATGAYNDILDLESIIPAPHNPRQCSTPKLLQG